MLDGADVSYGLAKEPSAERRIVVGLGDQVGLAIDGATTTLFIGKTPDKPSASSFIALADDRALQEWRRALRLNDGPDPFSGAELSVDDASPDTCLALVLLVRRLRGETVPLVWVDCATRWEEGDVHSTGMPETSWGALHSALVHPFFVHPTEPQAVRRAIECGTRYVAELIDLKLDPAHLPLSLPSRLHFMAHSRLAAERQRFLRLRDQATHFQLAVPVIGTSQRRLVDAMLVVEAEPTGAVKAWLRRDKTTFTGDGFAIMAVYRPTTQEITISADPMSGVTLKQLWTNLEHAEDEAWRRANEARPRDTPRPLVSFAHPVPGVVPCNEPWWDDHGNYTLVASPRRLSDGKTASRLSWTDVVEVLWDTFGPHIGLQLNARTPAPSNAGGLFDVDFQRRKPAPGCPSKWLVDLVLDAERSAEPPLWTPTLEAACAAYISSGDVRVNQLPISGDFDVLRGRGGAVVVNHDGVMLVETSAHAGFPVKEIKEIIGRQGEMLSIAMELETGVTDMKGVALRAARSGRARHKREALTAINGLMLNARQRVRPSAHATTDPLLKKLEQSIESRWDTTSRLQQVIDVAQDLEKMVVSSSEIRAAGLLDNIAIYGFPAMVFGNILGAAFAPMTASEHGPVFKEAMPWNAYGISWPALGIYLILTIVVTLMLSRITARVNRRWEKDIEIAQARRPQLSKPHKR